MSANTVWYRRPYPFFHSGIPRWRNAGLLLLFGFFFLFVFEPFDVYRPEHLFPFWLICLMQIGNVVVVYLLITGIVQYIVSEDDWTLGKELILMISFVLVMGTANFGLREVIYDNPENSSLRYLLEEIRNTFLVGSLILFVITTINARMLERENQRKAPVIQSANEHHTGSSITLETAAANESFTLHPDHLLCMKSDGNYLEVFQYREDTLHKEIIRLTLQEAAQQLEPFPNLLKTHRAYLVNLDRVIKATGNAQGYQLEVSHLPFTVPVTRKHLPAFRKSMPSV